MLGGIGSGLVGPQRALLDAGEQAVGDEGAAGEVEQVAHGATVQDAFEREMTKMPSWLTLATFSTLGNG